MIMDKDLVHHVILYHDKNYHVYEIYSNCHITQ